MARSNRVSCSHDQGEARTASGARTAVPSGVRSSPGGKSSLRPRSTKLIPASIAIPIVKKTRIALEIINTSANSGGHVEIVNTGHAGVGRYARKVAKDGVVPEGRIHAPTVFMRDEGLYYTGSTISSGDNTAAWDERLHKHRTIFDMLCLPGALVIVQLDDSLAPAEGRRFQDSGIRDVARRHLRVEGIGVGDEMRRRMANAKLAAKLPEAPFVVEAIEQLQVRQRKARRMQQMPTSNQRPRAGSFARQHHRDPEVAGQTIDFVGEILVVSPADDPVAWDVLVAVAGQGEGLAPRSPRMYTSARHRLAQRRTR